MSFIRILVGALFVFLVSGLPADQAANASPISTKPGLELLFNGVIHLADFSPPIPIPAGQRIVAKVNSGKLSGTGFSGTIQGGISVIDIINGGQAIVNSIRSFGVTSDGSSFLIEESGTGSPLDDFSRAVRILLPFIS